MKKNAILSLGFLFLMTSCSKDNQSAKQIEGSWNITSLKINSIETISVNTSAETTFSSIDKNTGRYNTKAYLLNALITDVNGSFNISEEGTNITLDEDGSSAPGTGTIEELSDSNLHITYIDKDDNTVIFRAKKE